MEKPIVVHCAKGNRSSLAAVTLNEMGYQAANVEGGFEAWEEAGLRVERGVQTDPLVHDASRQGPVAAEAPTQRTFSMRPAAEPAPKLSRAG